jgi:O-antigen/teichoic acid export membrane protein
MKSFISQVLRSGSGLIASTLAVLLANIVMSNAMSPEEFGGVTLVLTWAIILGQAAQFGLMRATPKIIANARDENNLMRIKAFVIFMFVLTVFWTGVLSLILWILNVSGVSFGSFPDKYLWAIILMILPFAIFRLGSGLMVGERRLFLGAFLQSGLPYGAIGIGVLLLASFGFLTSLDEYIHYIVYLVWCASLLTVGLMFFRTFDAFSVVGSEFRTKDWFVLTLPLMLVGVTQILNKNIGIVALGYSSEAEQAALFSIAVRISDFATFGLVAVNSAVAARVSVAYKNNNIEQLKRVMTQAALLCFGSSVLITVILALSMFHILALFGNYALSAASPLLILLVGQLINSMTGAVSVLLMMTGAEKFTSIASALTLLLNIVLMLALVPDFGAVGAAIATAITVIVWNLLLLGKCISYVGINPTVFTKFRKW